MSSFRGEHYRDGVYHPKVFLAHDKAGRAIRFLIGSSNLSSAAFSTSVEAGVLGNEPRCLKVISRWYEDLFINQSAQFTAPVLDEMERKWRENAALRARNRLRIRRVNVAAVPAIPVAPEDIDTLEDVLATIQLPLGLLNFDYAGNNVRNIKKLREVLAVPDEASDKQRSELKLLGFMVGGKLSDLGIRSASASTNMEVALLWCRWLKQTADAELGEINPKLLIAKRVLSQFWLLRQDVRDYFLANAKNPGERATLQTVELLCNASEVVQGLVLDDFRTLATLFQSDEVPQYVRDDVQEYFGNKGQRGWDTDDRRVVPLAWKDA